SFAFDARRRWEDVVAGRAHLEAVWTTADAAVRLWLVSEQGQLRMVLGMVREGPAAECRPEAIAGALMGLFPPAAADARAANARLLAACRVEGAAGALDTAMRHDPASRVQAEALRALDRIGQS